MPPQLQWHCPRSELQVWQDKGRSRKDITHGRHPVSTVLQVCGAGALPHWECSLLPGGWRATCCRTLIAEGESKPSSGRRRLTASSSGDNSGGC